MSVNHFALWKSRFFFAMEESVRMEGKGWKIMEYFKIFFLLCLVFVLGQGLPVDEEKLNSVESQLETLENDIDELKDLDQEDTEETKTHDNTKEKHENTTEKHENTTEKHENTAETHKNTTETHENTTETHENTTETHENTTETHENTTKLFDLDAISTTSHEANEELLREIISENGLDLDEVDRDPEEIPCEVNPDPYNRNGLGDNSYFLWPDGIVPYVIDAAFSDQEVLNIQEAIDSYNELFEGCLTWVKRSGQVSFSGFIVWKIIH